MDKLFPDCRLQIIHEHGFEKICVEFSIKDKIIFKRMIMFSKNLMETIFNDYMKYGEDYSEVVFNESVFKTKKRNEKIVLIKRILKNGW